MKILSLRSIYKNLLKEAILDQTSFLKGLVDIVKNKEDLSYDKDDILGILLNDIEETNLLNLTGKENKKARKQAEVLIHKSLKKIKGIDNESVDLKLIRPLYDSILNYLKTKKEVSIQDCLLAADFYMKDFYDSADESEKNSVNNGNIEFNLILKRTKFYSQYHEFRKEMGIFLDEGFRVYEDENIKIVYPTNSASFNEIIARSGVTVDWCTQRPETWQRYNDRQYVMIVIDKRDVYGLTSLKVEFDGTVNYQATCDVDNAHMDEKSVKKLLGNKAEEIIFNIVEKGYLDSEERSLIEPEEITVYLNGLLDSNNKESIIEMLVRYHYLNINSFYDAVNNFFDYADKKNKTSLAIECYVDAMSGLNFENQQVSNETWMFPLNTDLLSREFLDVLIKKCLDKKNHVKYFIALNDLYKNYNNNNNFKAAILKDNIIKEMALICLDKYNVLNFKKSLSSICKNKLICDALLKQKFYEIFKTKGFTAYFNEKLTKIFDFAGIDEDINRLSTDSFISFIIKNNKQKFIEFINENKSINESEIDTGILAKFIENKAVNDRIFDLADIDISELSSCFFNINEEKALEIINNLYTDINTVRYVCEKNVYLKQILLMHFMSKKLSYFLWNDTNKNRSIDFSNQNSYDVFVYLFDNPENLLTAPTASNFAIFISTIKIINEFGKTIENIDESLKNKLLNICNSTMFYTSISSTSTIEDEEIAERIFEIVKDSDISTIDGLKLDIIRKFIIDNNLKNLNSNNPQLKLFEKIASIEEIKNKLLKVKKVKDEFTNNKINIENILLSYYFYLKGNSSDPLVLNELINKYVKTIVYPRRLYSHMTGNISDVFDINVAIKINQIMLNTIDLNHKHFKIIQNFINYRNVYENPYFKDLLIKYVSKCNKENVSILKTKLYDIITEHQFVQLNDIERHDILENFITISASGEKNILGYNDRSIIKKCLEKSLLKQKILEKDRNYILELCKGLDHASQFQMSMIFPEDESLRNAERKIEETIIRNYIRSFLMI